MTTTTLALLLDMLIRIGLTIRVIMRRLEVGVALAWLGIILFLPLLGAVLYLLLGELRLGRQRAVRARQLNRQFTEWVRFFVDRHRNLTIAEPPLASVVRRSTGQPLVGNSALTLLHDWRESLEQLIADIDRAKYCVFLEFYIWQPGGMMNEVMASIVRAVDRGIECRVLLDAVGSRDFLKSAEARRLRRIGVDIHSALPANFLRAAFVRFDLRLHRKIAIVDYYIAYTGSLNLIDPRFFKTKMGLGEWVDAMVRVSGDASLFLAKVFANDWEMETGERILIKPECEITIPEDQQTKIQVVPSGPSHPNVSMLEILISFLYAAEREIILTTPYFVPESSLLTALKVAADRGVAVLIILPERVDSRLVHLASKAFQGDLYRRGVRIVQFTEGLLHTKSVTIDGQISFFGTVNMDPRSFHLNFETTLAIFDEVFTQDLRRLQLEYRKGSRPFQYELWDKRSFWRRFAENAARLAGPLL